MFLIEYKCFYHKINIQSQGDIEYEIQSEEMLEKHIDEKGNRIFRYLSGCNHF
jgi:hypothetical protein